MDLKEAMHRVVAEGYRVIAPGGLDITGWLEQESLLNTLVRPVKTGLREADLCSCSHPRVAHHGPETSCIVDGCPCDKFIVNRYPKDRLCTCGHGRGHHDTATSDSRCLTVNCICVVFKDAEWSGTSEADGTPQSRTADPVGALCGQAEDSEAIGCGHRMDYHLGARGVHIPGRCHAAGCACPKFIP